jgi:hypothetical protein
MPSSYTASLRLELQFTGENVNIWGERLNAVIGRLDDAVAGWADVVVDAAGHALTTANGGADEARKAMIRATGAGGVLTIPAVAKAYDIWNACSGVLTVSNGSASAAVQAGELVRIVTDGGANLSRVQMTSMGGARLTLVGAPINDADAATKKYVDAAAWAMNAGVLPGQTGNGGKFLTTDGAAAGWAEPVDRKLQRRRLFFSRELA